MSRKLVLVMTLTLLIGMLFVTLKVERLNASGTIYIKADGSIDPTTANITSTDNVTYTFTDDNYDSVVIERDNIVVDGVGYTLQGTGSGRGIYLERRSNVTIKNMQIKKFYNGIALSHSSSNSISGNNITNNWFGIRFSHSSHNTISVNNITNNEAGIWLDSSSSNSISGNCITNSTYYGVLLKSSSHNNVTSENVMNNNKYNFNIRGNRLSHFVHSIDVSNLVDGKSVYYLVNQTDLMVNSATHPHVGYLAFINCANVTVEGLLLTNNGEGLLFAYTNNSRITDSNITNNSWGVWLYSSSHNTISRNNITNNDCGVGFYSSSNNTIYGNSVTHIPSCGVGLYHSSNNKFYHNNFIDNVQQVHLDEFSYTNFWDNGYPSGGNFWGDYTGEDTYSGPYQNETGSDAIRDMSYVFDASNRDNYPLMGMFYDFEVTVEHGDVHHVQLISNSAVLDLAVSWWLSSPNEYLQPGQKFIIFFVVGEENTTGFCRVTIPRTVLNGTYTVLVDWEEVSANELIVSNTTHAYLYFTYQQSKHEVIIVPEFQTFILLPLFMIAISLSVMVCRRKH